MCQSCPKRFVDQRSLNKHASGVHAKKFRCEICGKGFTEVQRFNYHLRKVHDGASDEEDSSEETYTNMPIKTEVLTQQNSL